MSAEPTAGTCVIATDARRLDLHNAGLECLEDRRHHTTYQAVTQLHKESRIVQGDILAPLDVPIGEVGTERRSYAVGQLFAAPPRLQHPFGRGVDLWMGG